MKNWIKILSASVLLLTQAGQTLLAAPPAAAPKPWVSTIRDIGFNDGMYFSGTSCQTRRRAILDRVISEIKAKCLLQESCSYVLDASVVGEAAPPCDASAQMSAILVCRTADEDKAIAANPNKLNVQFRSPIGQVSLLLKNGEKYDFSCAPPTVTVQLPGAAPSVGQQPATSGNGPARYNPFAGYANNTAPTNTSGNGSGSYNPFAGYANNTAPTNGNPPGNKPNTAPPPPAIAAQPTTPLAGNKPNPTAPAPSTPYNPFAGYKPNPAPPAPLPVNPTPPVPSKGIGVTAAYYGANCSPNRNFVSSFTNPAALRELVASCNGQFNCTYRIDNKRIGDPMFGCAKDFSVQWTCDGKGSFSASLPAEASGQAVALSCAGSAAPPAGTAYNPFAGIKPNTPAPMPTNPFAGNKPNATPVVTATGISVTSVYYGPPAINFDQMPRYLNQTALNEMVLVCTGRSECTYSIDRKRLLGVIDQTSPHFTVQWKCNGAGLNSVTDISPVGWSGGKVTLRCPAQSTPQAGTPYNPFAGSKPNTTAPIPIPPGNPFAGNKPNTPASMPTNPFAGNKPNTPAVGFFGNPMSNNFTVGKCLQTVGVSDVRLMACNNTLAQRWQQVSTAQAGLYNIKNTATGQCLNVTRDRSINMRDCNAAADFHVMPWAAGNPNPYRLQNDGAQDGCLDVLNDATKDKVKLATCGNYSGQAWK